MKKITHYIKIFISIILKTIVGILMGIGLSFGKNPVEIKKKDNKTIEANK